MSPEATSIQTSSRETSSSTTDLGSLEFQSSAPALTPSGTTSSSTYNLVSTLSTILSQTASTLAASSGPISSGSSSIGDTPVSTERGASEDSYSTLDTISSDAASLSAGSGPSDTETSLAAQASSSAPNEASLESPISTATTPNIGSTNLITGTTTPRDIGETSPVSQSEPSPPATKSAIGGVSIPDNDTTDSGEGTQDFRCEADVKRSMATDGFKVKCNKEVVSEDGNLIDSLDAVTVFDCIRICKEQLTCVAFNHDDLSEKCEIFSAVYHVVSAPGIAKGQRLPLSSTSSTAFVSSTENSAQSTAASFPVAVTSNATGESASSTESSDEPFSAISTGVFSTVPESADPAPSQNTDDALTSTMASAQSSDAGSSQPSESTSARDVSITSSASNGVASLGDSSTHSRAPTTESNEEVTSSLMNASPEQSEASTLVASGIASQSSAQSTAQGTDSSTTPEQIPGATAAITSAPALSTPSAPSEEPSSSSTTLDAGFSTTSSGAVYTTITSFGLQFSDLFTSTIVPYIAGPLTTEGTIVVNSPPQFITKTVYDPTATRQTSTDYTIGPVATVIIVDHAIYTTITSYDTRFEAPSTSTIASFNAGPPLTIGTIGVDSPPHFETFTSYGDFATVTVTTIYKNGAAIATVISQLPATATSTTSPGSTADSAAGSMTPSSDFIDTMQSIPTTIDASLSTEQVSRSTAAQDQEITSVLNTAASGSSTSMLNDTPSAQSTTSLESEATGTAAVTGAPNETESPEIDPTPTLTSVANSDGLTSSSASGSSTSTAAVSSSTMSSTDEDPEIDPGTVIDDTIFSGCLTGDTASAQIGGFNVVCGQKVTSGNMIRSGPATSMDDCINMCAGQPTCIAFNFSAEENTCETFDAVTGPLELADTVAVGQRPPVSTTSQNTITTTTESSSGAATALLTTEASLTQADESTSPVSIESLSSFIVPQQTSSSTDPIPEEATSPSSEAALESTDMSSTSLTTSNEAGATSAASITVGATSQDGNAPTTISQIIDNMTTTQTGEAAVSSFQSDEATLTTPADINSTSTFSTSEEGHSMASLDSQADASTSTDQNPVPSTSTAKQLESSNAVAQESGINSTMILIIDTTTPLEIIENTSTTIEKVDTNTPSSTASTIAQDAGISISSTSVALSNPANVGGFESASTSITQDTETLTTSAQSVDSGPSPTDFAEQTTLSAAGDLNSSGPTQISLPATSLSIGTGTGISADSLPVTTPEVSTVAPVQSSSSSAEPQIPSLTTPFLSTEVVASEADNATPSIGTPSASANGLPFTEPTPGLVSSDTPVSTFITNSGQPTSFSNGDAAQSATSDDESSTGVTVSLSSPSELLSSTIPEIESTLVAGLEPQVATTAVELSPAESETSAASITSIEGFPFIETTVNASPSSSGDESIPRPSTSDMSSEDADAMPAQTASPTIASPDPISSEDLPSTAAGPAEDTETVLSTDTVEIPGGLTSFTLSPTTVEDVMPSVDSTSGPKIIDIGSPSSNGDGPSTIGDILSTSTSEDSAQLTSQDSASPPTDMSSTASSYISTTTLDMGSDISPVSSSSIASDDGDVGDDENGTTFIDDELSTALSTVSSIASEISTEIAGLTTTTIHELSSPTPVIGNDVSSALSTVSNIASDIASQPAGFTTTTSDEVLVPTSIAENEVSSAFSTASVDTSKADDLESSASSTRAGFFSAVSAVPSTDATNVLQTSTPAIEDIPSISSIDIDAGSSSTMSGGPTISAPFSIDASTPSNPEPSTPSINLMSSTTSIEAGVSFSAESSTVVSTPSDLEPSPTSIDSFPSNISIEAGISLSDPSSTDVSTPGQLETLTATIVNIPSNGVSIPSVPGESDTTTTTLSIVDPTSVLENLPPTSNVLGPTSVFESISSGTDVLNSESRSVSQSSSRTADIPGPTSVLESVPPSGDVVQFSSAPPIETDTSSSALSVGELFSTSTSDLSIGASSSESPAPTIPVAIRDSVSIDQQITSETVRLSSTSTFASETETSSLVVTRASLNQATDSITSVSAPDLQSTGLSPSLSLPEIPTTLPSRSVTTGDVGLPTSITTPEIPFISSTSDFLQSSATSEAEPTTTTDTEMPAGSTTVSVQDGVPAPTSLESQLTSAIDNLPQISTFSASSSETVASMSSTPEIVLQNSTAAPFVSASIPEVLPENVLPNTNMDSPSTTPTTEVFGENRSSTAPTISASLPEVLSGNVLSTTTMDVSTTTATELSSEVNSSTAPEAESGIASTVSSILETGIQITTAPAGPTSVQESAASSLGSVISSVSSGIAPTTAFTTSEEISTIQSGTESKIDGTTSSTVAIPGLTTASSSLGTEFRSSEDTTVIQVNTAGNSTATFSAPADLESTVSSLVSQAPAVSLEIMTASTPYVPEISVDRSSTASSLTVAIAGLTSTSFASVTDASESTASPSSEDTSAAKSSTSADSLPAQAGLESTVIPLISQVSSVSLEIPTGSVSNVPESTDGPASTASSPTIATPDLTSTSSASPTDTIEMTASPSNEDTSAAQSSTSPDSLTAQVGLESTVASSFSQFSSVSLDSLSGPEIISSLPSTATSFNVPGLTSTLFETSSLNDPSSTSASSGEIFESTATVISGSFQVPLRLINRPPSPPAMEESWTLPQLSIRVSLCPLPNINSIRALQLIRLLT
ncbi:unnamed protein product [Zymoseptoria tritici ST99CH_3D7]|uniref:Apple domain-containing protein n=1 Tax=Zymoseptoria tritici (strain ST99CH_3D7) TaxID=1276538 RepID=A0A1X7RY43_ZYMT9|nr:unnamed protein product [Zymoseptoria tritici ST99CH_3D7]